MTCSVDGCERIVKARGLCKNHYKKWQLDTTLIYCSVDKCDGAVEAHGLCSKHYKRWLKYGDPLTILKAEDGAQKEFIEMALNHQDKEECLFWPYGKCNGYAVHGGGRIVGSSRFVCRVICEHIKGPPPTTKHEACHNCGKGHLGCVNPHHLRWDTHTNNMADKIIHSTTNRGEQSGMAVLTWEKVREIRSMQGKLSGPKVSTIFGVSNVTIYDIWNGKRWKE